MPAQSLSRRFVSLLLALVVLVASVGLPVQRRTCRLSGRSTATIGWGIAALGTLPGVAQGVKSRLAGTCYAYSLTLHQVSASMGPAAFKKLLSNEPVWLATEPPAAIEMLGRLMRRPESGGKRVNFRVPPRLGGRRLLVRLRRWIV